MMRIHLLRHPKADAPEFSRSVQSPRELHRFLLERHDTYCVAVECPSGPLLVVYNIGYITIRGGFDLPMRDVETLWERCEMTRLRDEAVDLFLGRLRETIIRPAVYGKPRLVSDTPLSAASPAVRPHPTETPVRAERPEWTKRINHAERRARTARRAHEAKQERQEAERLADIAADASHAARMAGRLLIHADRTPAIGDLIDVRGEQRRVVALGRIFGGEKIVTVFGSQITPRTRYVYTEAP